MTIGLDLGNLLVHLKADTVQYDRQLKKAVTTMRIVSRRIIGIARGMALRLGSMLNRFGHFIGRWAKRLGIALVAVGVFSVKAFADFDDAMIKSLAIMGDVSEGMQQQMRDLAMTLSTEGVTSATDLAKSYFFLASAGLTAEQSIAALATVERFAVAGAFDMAEATDLLTDAQSALGKTVDDSAKNMENMAKISDVLTGANTLANASTRQFSLALTTQAGSAMKVFNVQLEQGVAVLAAYADQGIKAQRAGTMFSRMLRLMTKGFRENEPVWKKLKISIFDSAGELLDMSEIIRQLSDALGDMSTQQKVAALDMLGFQARSQQTILPLLGLGERIEEYTRKLEKMNGITKEVHEKQLRSFSSQMKILWNNIKSVAIAIGERLAPELIKFSNWFRANRETIEKWAVAFADRIISVKDNLSDLIAFMRKDFHAGLNLAINISLELFIGFGKGIIAIMKDAAIKSADAFIKIYGERLGTWLIEESAIMGQTMWETFRDFPLTGALRGEMLKMGVKLIEGAEKPTILTNLKEDLKIIITDTKESIKLLKEATGLGDTITGETDREKRERELLQRLKTTPIEKVIGGEAAPIRKVVEGEAITFGLSKAERRILRMEKTVTDSIQRMRDKAEEPLIVALAERREIGFDIKLEAFNKEMNRLSKLSIDVDFELPLEELNKEMDRLSKLFSVIDIRLSSEEFDKEMDRIQKMMDQAQGTFKLSLEVSEKELNSIQEMMDEARKIFEAPLPEGFNILPTTVEYERDLKRIELLEKRGLMRIATQRKKLLGEDGRIGRPRLWVSRVRMPRVRMPRDRFFQDMKDNFAEMMSLIQGGTFERFQVVRTALVDPRSENVTMIDLNRQQLMEAKQQTQLLRNIDTDEGG